MSEQRNLIKLKGNLDGISFYQLAGKYVARRANGPDKQRILKDPRFQRTRENNGEFGGCATAAKAFRRTLGAVIAMADPRFSGRLTGIFRAIISRGEGIRGQRPINLTENSIQLVNMEFNADRSVTSLFTGMYIPANSADRTMGSVSISKVLLDNAAQAPAGATHVRFTHALGVMSNYAYDTELKRYAPIDAALDKLQAVTESDFIALNDKTPLSLTLDTVLPGNPVLNENVSVVQCFGVSYYQLMKARYHPLLASTGLKVVNVF